MKLNARFDSTRNRSDDRGEGRLTYDEDQAIRRYDQTKKNMKTHLDITISAANADQFDSFTPVLGAWTILSSEGDVSEIDIRDSVRNWMDDPHCRVEVFGADGHAIDNGDIPNNGTFLATRSRA
jgi:hypothetical protein